MKNRIVSGILAASFLVVLSAALAYAGSTGRVNATVPFAFTVEDVSFPSGEYTISETSIQGYLLIRNTRGNVSTFVSALAGPTSGTSGDAKVTFNRYGEKYFLSEVFFGIDSDSRELSMSKIEKDFAGAARSTAHNSRQPEVVVVGSH